MLIIDNVVIDKDKKKYLFIPTGCGAGIPGPNVSKQMNMYVFRIRHSDISNGAVVTRI